MRSINKILEEYEIASKKIFDEAMYGTHDNRIINAEEKKVIKLFYEFIEDEDFKTKCIDYLWNSDNAYSKVHAPIYCLALNMRVEEALERLEILKDDMTVAPFASYAYIALDLWKTNGKIVIGK